MPLPRALHVTLALVSLDYTLYVWHVDIVIGVPAFRDPGEVTLGEALGLPFRHQRPWRLLPNNGEPPPRQVSDPMATSAE